MRIDHNTFPELERWLHPVEVWPIKGYGGDFLISVKNVGLPPSLPEGFWLIKGKSGRLTYLSDRYFHEKYEELLPR